MNHNLQSSEKPAPVQFLTRFYLLISPTKQNDQLAKQIMTMQQPLIKFYLHCQLLHANILVYLTWLQYFSSPLFVQWNSKSVQDMVFLTTPTVQMKTQPTLVKALDKVRDRTHIIWGIHRCHPLYLQ